MLQKSTYVAMHLSVCMCAQAIWWSGKCEEGKPMGWAAVTVSAPFVTSQHGTSCRHLLILWFLKSALEI